MIESSNSKGKDVVLALLITVSLFFIIIIIGAFSHFAIIPFCMRNDNIYINDCPASNSNIFISVTDPKSGTVIKEHSVKGYVSCNDTLVFKKDMIDIFSLIPEHIDTLQVFILLDERGNNFTYVRFSDSIVGFPSH